MKHDSDDTGTAAIYRYLYAIVPRGLLLPAGLCGLDGQPVTLIDCAGAAAAVSASARLQLRPERAHLAAHQSVVNALMSVATVLPVAFGTIAQSGDELQQYIADSAEPIAQQLAHVHGSAEFGLRVRLNVPDVFAYLAEMLPELRAQRDAAFGNGRSPGHHERIALGMQVERALALLRERHAAQLLPALTTVCIDICRNPPRATGELLNLACLVRRHDQQAFDDELSRAASGFDDDVTFEISGPWAPHHFCSIRFVSGDSDVRD